MPKQEKHADPNTLLGQLQIQTVGCRSMGRRRGAHRGTASRSKGIEVFARLTRVGQFCSQVPARPSGLLTLNRLALLIVCIPSARESLSWALGIWGTEQKNCQSPSPTRKTGDRQICIVDFR
jgi:hypothetical protein